MVDVERLRSDLESLVASLATCSRIEVYVHEAGAGAPVVVNTADAPSRDLLWNLWCTSKPLVPISLAFLELERDIQILDSTPFDNQPSATVVDILSHAMGMSSPTAWEVTLMAPGDRQAAASKALSKARPGTMAYSEYSAWQALSNLIGDIVGFDSSDFVQEKIVSELLGVHDLLVSRPPHPAQRSSRHRGASLPRGAYQLARWRVQWCQRQGGDRSKPVRGGAPHPQWR